MEIMMYKSIHYRNQVINSLLSHIHAIYFATIVSTGYSSITYNIIEQYPLILIDLPTVARGIRSFFAGC